MSSDESDVLECKRCGYAWYSKRTEIPAVCPACKSHYWNTERRRGFRKIHEKGAALAMIKYCPVCNEEKDSYLNLARHMVLKDRPYGEHQQWLQDFLGKEFPEYAFKHDKDIANALRIYWTQRRSWPA